MSSLKNPTSAQVQTVIDNFNNVLPMATLENHLNMRCGAVNAGRHKCGTIHCHSGWYAIATCDLNAKTTFLEGLEIMAAHLGFEREYEIEIWADKKTKIWGNVYGYCLSVDEKAFKHPTKRPNGAQNLQHIIDHWCEVRDRLIVLENEVATSNTATS